MKTENISRLAQSSELLYMLAWRDIRIRYKQSVMGLLWAILTPALLVGAGLLVRAAIARYAGTELMADEIGSVMVRALCWSFFIGALRFGTQSLLSNASLVTKIAFPREVLPLSAVMVASVDFAVAAVVTVIIIVIMGWTPSVHAMWAFVFLATLLAMTTGLTLVLAAANLFFRDVKYLVEVVLTYAIFCTPVLYEASFAGEWETWLMLNPISSVLEGMAATLIFHRNPDPAWTAYSVATGLIILVVGYWSFKRLEPRFAESI